MKNNRTLVAALVLVLGFAATSVMAEEGSNFPEDPTWYFTQDGE
jgi:hypothetical protein